MKEGLTMRWLHSVFVVMFLGFIFMVVCCSISLHYRLESLVILYNAGLLVGVAACAYAMVVMTYLVLQGRETNGDIVYLTGGIITYGIFMYLYSYRGFVINHFSVPISTLICLGWLCFLESRTKKLRR